MLLLNDVVADRSVVYLKIALIRVDSIDLEMSPVCPNDFEHLLSKLSKEKSLS